MREFEFKTTRGETIDNVIEYIKNRLENDELKNDYQIYVGCDSLPTKKGTATYSTVIVLYRVGKGAQILFNREKNIKVHGTTKRERMKNRLWEEIYRAVDVALLLTDSDLFDNKQITDFQVHIDVNPNEDYESNLIYKEAMGYLNSLGFDAYAKPEAMAASYASDSICRGYTTKVND